MDEALYRLHAQREETYWWWVGKNRIILDLIDRYWFQAQPARASPAANTTTTTSRPVALDIGCGAGGVLARLHEQFDAVGIDMSPIAREYCAKRGLKALDGSLPDKLPITEPGSVDVIVLSEVIEHVKPDRASVQAVAKLLRPGGVLVCTVPAHMWLWSSHDDFNFHQRRYTRSGFGGLFENTGLEQVILSYYQAASLPLVVGARWAEKLRTKITGKAPPEPTVKPLPGPINWTLAQAFSFERHILPRARLPWGTSVISVHRRSMNP